MVPTSSPTAVEAEPMYAKLRQTETLELREARGFFAKLSWAALNIAFVYPIPIPPWAASNRGGGGRAPPKYSRKF